MGRARVQRIVHQIELSPRTEKKLDETLKEVANFTPGLFIARAMSGINYTDVMLAGTGFWFGYKFNLSIPGGIVLQHLGIPDFTEEVGLHAKAVKTAEADIPGLVDALEEAMAYWAGILAQEMPDKERAKVIAHSEQLIQGIRDTLDTRRQQLEEFSKLLQQFKFGQGMVYAIWLLLLKYGILTGIGEIIPL